MHPSFDGHGAHEGKGTDKEILQKESCKQFRIVITCDNAKLVHKTALVDHTQPTGSKDRTRHKREGSQFKWGGGPEKYLRRPKKVRPPPSSM